MSSKLLWQPKEKVVRFSSLNKFCNILEEKKYLKNNFFFFRSLEVDN